MKYPRIKEGDPRFIKWSEDCFECCCDCGLVHRVVIEKEHSGEGVVLRVWRDDRRTAQIRRGGDVGLLSGGCARWKMTRKR